MVDCTLTRVEDRNAMVLRLLPTIRKFASRHCSNAETARDVVQEVVARLLESPPPTRPEVNVAWTVHRLVRRVAFRVKRRIVIRADRESDFSILGTETRDFEPVIEDAPEERAAKRETVYQVRQVLRMMTPEERRMVREPSGRYRRLRTAAARNKFRELLAARNLDAVAADGTVPVEDLIPMKEAAARLGLKVRTELLSKTLVRNRVFVSARMVRLMPRPIQRRCAKADHRRPLPEPQPGRLWRIREVAELLGGLESKVVRLIASGKLPARKAVLPAGPFGSRPMTVEDDADVRALYQSYGDK